MGCGTLCEWLKISILFLVVMALIGGLIGIGHWIYLARQAVRQSRENRMLHEQVAAIFAVLQDDWVQFSAWRARREAVASGPITARTVAANDNEFGDTGPLTERTPAISQRAISTPRL